MILQERVSLAPYTTLCVGGAARFFIEAQSVEEVVEALDFVHTHTLPLFVLGGGSNILVADEWFDGLVLAVRLPGITFEERDRDVLVTAGAGVLWDELVARAVERGLAGLECLSGIPGTVGGAVVANIGAYGAQASDTLVSAEMIDTQERSNKLQMMEKEACGFAYHDSTFSRDPGRYVILRATFALARDGAPRLAYRDNRFNVAELVSSSGRVPTLGDVRNAVMEVRKEKGVLSDSYKSAGSFFHMPYVTAEKYAEIAAHARSLDVAKEECLRPWAWREPNGSYKLAPGFLLEYTPFQKGYVQGAIGISPKHTLSIINIGKGRARDVAVLARDMQDAVEKMFGVRLLREVEYVGDIENK